jgi:DNA replicative helicase MCM subunit Mcm2 (Cdc46/Mcm family)
MRYITIKVIKDAPKIFGLDRVDINKRVYVVEGPIDSLFLYNAIAVAGSNLDSEYLKFNDSIFIMDNERRNKEIIKKMEKIIEEGRTICIWPESVEEKDLNDMILAGYTPKEIQGIIDKNSHKGLDAEISLGEWRKC